METQVNMAHRDLQEERTKEITEEQFLKDLYLFMKKRETPIERIPHLGFKQIDLFVMFKTVNDLGGYHQVTAQQLWKKVYNTLGGNPRSTSAATCTRRHYEKLLLPYECHMKGIILSAVPHLQPKAFHYPAFIREEEDDGQRASKRKLLSIPLHQSPLNLQSNPTGSLIPLPLFHPFYPPIHSVLPPFSPISSSVLTAPPPTSSAPPKPPQPPLCPPPLTPSEPLEHLRYLAKRYKSSSGLAEPLNLSIRASSRQTDSNPVSSFTPPASSKIPKFLNKPSSLYSPHHAGTVRTNETQDGESVSDGVQSHSEVPSPEVIDVDAIAASSSPACDGEVVVLAQKPGSPKTDFTARLKEERKEATDLQQGKMEIEIPLSMFQNWLRWCSSPAKYPPLPAQEEGRRADTIPANWTFHMNPQKQSSAENRRLRNEPSPPPYIGQTSGNQCITGQTSGNHSNPGQMSGNHHNMGQTSGNHSITRQTSGNHHNPYTTTNLWDIYSGESPTSPVQVKTDSSPIKTQQDFVSKISPEDVMQPSALLMLNSSPASVLHLTTEEVMKLKKIISSSS